MITIQPDALLPDYGAFDALALVADPNLAGPFTVSLFWIGSGTPGPQDFVIYDTDFSTLETGVTMPIPEPGTALLLGLGLAGLGLTGRRDTAKVRAS